MQPGTLVAGKYRIERIIGRGGMGLVVEATHVALQARVALKFLAEEMVSEPTALARFQREARASAQLKSEHVCRVSDFGVEGKTPYIAMELLTGTDLARLSKVRLLDAATAALYVKQACVGLAEAHAAGIVHRDLKPGNLFLSRRADGSPLIKVLDFGVAKAPEGEGDVKLTGTSNVVGSPGFMSPEQFRHSRSVDGRTDIWSLGVILYKLVSGRLPFKADNFAEFALAISRDPMPPLPEAPPELESIVARCLEKDPAKRFADVTDLAYALAPLADRARPSNPTIADVVPPHDPNEIASGIGSLPPGGIAQPPPAQGIGAPAPSGAQTRLHPHPAGDVKKPVQTILGVTTPQVTAPVAPLNMRPTAAETAVPSGTLSGVGGSLAGAGELAPGTQVGEYRIERKIGEGGMGVVYAATHPLIGKKAAIKVISADLGTDETLVQRFVQEARSVNQIGHPNIVDVFAFGQLRDGRNYFVMELLQGESLRGKLTRQFVPLSDAVQILDEVANALEAAHEKGIVHRDLKPDNVFLASVRNNYIIVKLLDFGIAKLAANEGGISKTSTGQMMGTPGYLSPEQARGKNVDYRTDIYALGCLMYEMVTGRLPFISESPMDIVMMHLSTPVTKPSVHKPDIPVQLDQLIVQMMDKDPAKRPTLSYVRDVFAELVASGIVPIEAGTGITFRSDLRRRRESEVRTPSGMTPKPVPVAPAAAETLGRRRTPSPSDAPTAIAFTPGPDTLTPHATIVADKPRAKSRRGIATAIVLAALLVPAVTIVLAMVNRETKAGPSDAAVAQVATPDAQVAVAQVADAGVPDATSTAPAAKHLVELRVNVSTAKIEIDGVPVAATKGIAKISLAEGDHHVLVSAAGREPYVTTLTIPSTAIVDIKLERPKRTTTTSQGEQPKEPQGSAAKPPAGSGSADPNYTVDPFDD